MKKIDVFISVEDERWQEAVPQIETVAEKVANMAAEYVKDSVSFLAYDKIFSINLCLSDDAQVHRLNREFRGMDKPTNVLSFANQEDDDFKILLEADQVELGDVIVAFETMEREATEQGVSLHDHFCHLWLHGILHVLGYDHIEETEAAEMEQLEISILAQLGIDNPYQE